MLGLLLFGCVVVILVNVRALGLLIVLFVCYLLLGCIGFCDVFI